MRHSPSLTLDTLILMTVSSSTCASMETPRDGQDASLVKPSMMLARNANGPGGFLNGKLIIKYNLKKFASSDNLVFVKVIIFIKISFTAPTGTRVN